MSEILIPLALVLTSFGAVLAVYRINKLEARIKVLEKVVLTIAKGNL